jgi:hypothetical protein
MTISPGPANGLGAPRISRGLLEGESIQAALFSAIVCGTLCCLQVVHVQDEEKANRGRRNEGVYIESARMHNY